MRKREKAFLAWKGKCLEGITVEIARWDMEVVKSPAALYSPLSPRFYVRSRPGALGKENRKGCGFNFSTQLIIAACAADSKLRSATDPLHSARTSKRRPEGYSDDLTSLDL